MEYKENFTTSDLEGQGGKYNPKNPEEAGEILGKKDMLESLFNSIPVLGPLLNDFRDTFSMVSDSMAGNYGLSFATLAALVGALAYIISPIDLIPDIVPILGFTDDAAFFTLVFKCHQKEIEAYRAWKKDH